MDVQAKANGIFKTKKAARQAGYVGEREMSSGRIVPRLHAEPSAIKGEKFWARTDCERLLNKTDARRAGLRIPSGKEPVEWRSWKYGRFGLWRESDLVPVAKRNSKPPATIDLLAAVFGVNRSAKRYRNAASGCYSSGTHGLAKAAKLRKESLYDLKDRGIAEGYRRGRIQFVGRNGTLALYRGDGYCFHSRLLPPGSSAEHDEGVVPVFVEAKPRSSKEARLKDAICTLESLPEPVGFTVLTAPRLVRVQSDRNWDEGDRWNDDDWDDDDYEYGEDIG